MKDGGRFSLPSPLMRLRSWGNFQSLWLSIGTLSVRGCEGSVNIKHPTVSVETEQQVTSFQTSITKGEINDLPLFRYEGKITLVSKDEDVPEALTRIRKEKYLGFDTESRPTFERGVTYPVSLLQLACTDEVFLFQLGQIKDISPIMKILSNGRIQKAGVAIHDDIKKLKELHDFRAAAFVEISKLTSQLGIVNTGLRSLCALLLKVRISKGAQVSNWARTDLTEQQINYAATDAWVSRELVRVLKELQEQDGVELKVPGPPLN